MRNIVTLSHIPKELHDWLKEEAARCSKAAGKRVSISLIVTQAIREYKERHNSTSRRSKYEIPVVEIFRKKIMPAEFGRGCICLPVSERPHFGIGNTITMHDADDGSTILVHVRSEHRLDMRDWYDHHPKVKPGDEIIFEQQKDGFIDIKVAAI